MTWWGRAKTLITGWTALVLGVLINNEVNATPPVRFVVAEFPGASFHHDSYVLPLSDPQAIAHARELIAFGASVPDSIAIANIESGSDGINRNVLALGAPPWSWHVTEFLGYAEITAEVLDGWPTGIELYPEYWLHNGGGSIGFWSYTVTAELPQGDYDFDFVVDGDDYEIWRTNFGTTANLAADGNGDGVVDLADYTIWRDHLGNRSFPGSGSSGASAAVPEPLNTCLIMAFLSPFTFVRRQRSLHNRRPRKLLT